MSAGNQEIQHVSDTALMVAACRALETEADDGFLRDPFAARLGGERGMKMLEALPSPMMMRFGVGIRTRFLDELLLEALGADRIATVLSVGCGLDTRPWRLELPPELRWIEVDFPDMLDYKDERMAGESTRCRRERLTADLNDAEQRRAVWSAAGAGPALMITEGLLMYLPGATVEAIAAESGQPGGIRHWISDISTTQFAKAINLDTMQSIRHVQADDHLPGEEILAVVLRNGWVGAARRSYITDTAFARERAMKLMGNRGPAPAPPPFAAGDPTGVHRFARS